MVQSAQAQGVSAVEVRYVGVIVERVRIDHPWADHRWAAVQILTAAPADVAPWTEVGAEADRTRFFAGSAGLVLYPRETDTLKHNLESGQPAVYVFLRACAGFPGITLLGVTACPGEAHAHADSGSDLVEVVPMPAEIVAWVGGFVSLHHVDRPVYRRQRDRHDPEALATRPGGGAALVSPGECHDDGE